MSESSRLAKTTVSINDIPANEREEYLHGLPPARLLWALHEAAEQAMPDPVHGKTGDAQLFDNMMALGSFGLIAAAQDLQTARKLASCDIADLVPRIVERLNEMQAQL